MPRGSGQAPRSRCCIVSTFARSPVDANRASRRIRQVRHRRTAHPLPSAPIPMLEFAFEMPGGGVDILTILHDVEFSMRVAAICTSVTLASHIHRGC